MTPELVIDIGREAIWVTLKVGGPILAVALVVGLAVSLFQALTQIQEMTLTFVPKILVIFGALALMLPFMLSSMNTFMGQISTLIITGG